MKIARIYDDSGQSRFTDIDISLNPRKPFGGVSGLRASAPFASGGCFLFSSPPCCMGPYPAPQRQLVIILSGKLEIETGDGNTRHFGPGDMLLADDTTGSGHLARCLTEVTVLLVPVADIPV